jgi:hypothetical protein
MNVYLPFVLGNLTWPKGLTPLHSPCVFSHEMTHTAFNCSGIGRTVVQSTDARRMLLWIKGAVDMTTLAVFRDDLVTFLWR